MRSTFLTLLIIAFSVSSVSAEQQVFFLALAPQDVTTLTITLSADQEPAVIRSVQSSCRCIQAVTPLPLTIARRSTGQLTLSVRGGLYGTKTVGITGNGHQPRRLSVTVTHPDGSGSNADQLRTLVHEAKRMHGTMTLLAHDLGDGSVPQCDCSREPLGGVERLQAAHKIALQTGAPLRLWLSGRVNQRHAGITQLIDAGWALSPKEAVLVSPRPMTTILKNRTHGSFHKQVCRRVGIYASSTPGPAKGPALLR